MKKVVWTRTARKSLVKTAEFILEVWDDSIQDRFLNQVDYRISQIQKNPELGPSFKERDFRQVQIHRTTSLFYKIYPEHLKILLIWDNRQDPTKLFKSLTSNKD